MKSLALRGWVIRAVVAMLPVYAFWWLAQLDGFFIEAFRLALNATLPALLPDLESIGSQATGGWVLKTSVRTVESGALLGVNVDAAFLGRAVMPIPGTLMLVWASSPTNWRKLMLAMIAALAVSVTVLAVCVAAHVAVMVSHTPAILDDDILPLPPGVALDSAPYPMWLFHMITFANYLGMLVAPLAAPVMVWIITCHREIRGLIRPGDT